MVSERNGDKARFGRERKKKILRRKRSRELRKALGLGNKTDKPTGAESKYGFGLEAAGDPGLVRYR